MIKTPTTFVIGAGASCSYGLPAAEGLHKAALRLEPESVLYQLLLTCAFSVEQLNGFLVDLRRNPTESIDSFLEKRQDRPDTMKVGRAVMAGLMGQVIAEIRPRQPQREEDWLGYVIDRMHRGAATLRDFLNGNDHVRFVTFNFDSIIEDRIGADLQSLYGGLTDPQLASALQVLEVIHVHGRLPRVPDVPLKYDSVYGPPMQWREWLPAAASQINVVLDTIDREVLERARAAVLQARVLCFLGFAYDTVNLERLNLPRAFQHGRFMPNTYGSACGFERGERRWIKDRFLPASIHLAPMGYTCRRVLRECHIFRD